MADATCMMEDGVVRQPAIKRPQRSDGEAKLAVKRGADGSTRIADLHQRANAKVRLPTVHDGPMRAVLINTSGGLTGGDLLKWTVEAGDGTDLAVTTQAAERAYRSVTGEASVMTSLKVGRDAALFWIPHETILFDGSSLARSIEVDLDERATLLAAETLVFGRQATGEILGTGTIRDRWRVKRAGKPLHADDIAVNFTKDALTGPAMTNGMHVVATMLYSAPDLDPSLVDGLRASMDGLQKPTRIGISAPQGRVIVRIVGADNRAVQSALCAVIDSIAPALSIHALWNV